MPNPNTNRLNWRRWAVWAAVAWTLFIPLMSLVPPAFFAMADSKVRIPGFDKLVHAVIYGVHAGLLIAAGFSTGRFSISHACAPAVALAGGYGLLMEILQKLVTHCRHFSWGDAVANLLGAILAAVFLFFYDRKQGKASIP